jgi:hypothetical protein
MQRLASLLRSPFSFLFTRSNAEDRVAAYVLREHARGRPLAEILDDPYVRNWSTPEERRRLLDLPEVVAALGANALDDLRGAVRTHPGAAVQDTEVVSDARGGGVQGPGRDR